ncbi:MAG: 50S ribosomal protein L4 [Candidatus Pacebacteria bacterium CG_4_10_14_0_8_um_filter_43_12]|nr:MAG: 50S ribosomal protein L4 [Candidatus Pacebacteria bacterium CG_4_10_14_0_8_um_filter_43_12]
MKVTAITTSGIKSTVTVSDELFGGSVNQILMAQVLRVYGVNQHQGTSKVKTRSEVKRTKKKWFKQKGTGNARHGARSAPIFVGGGVAHGPKGVQAGALKLSQKQKAQALLSALRMQASHIIVTEGLEKLAPKTSQVVATLKKIVPEDDLILIIVKGRQPDLEQGTANIASTKVIAAEQVTLVDVCLADTLILSPAAVTILETRLLKTRVVTKATKPAVKELTVAEAVVKTPVTTIAKKAVKLVVKKAATKSVKKPATKAIKKQ